MTLKSTSIYDLEIIITPDGGDPQSAAAINCKFSYLEGQSFKMSPESEHENPYLFIISKETLMEMLIPVEKGKPSVYINSESSIVTVEELVYQLISK